MKKFITKFDTTAELTTFSTTTDFGRPHVSLTEDDSKIHYFKYDPYNGHEYVEIGGLKWATMNIGASQPSDYGLYFAWGETQGYTAEQVGRGEGQRYFGWADYKYGNGTSSQDATEMTKYNEADGKTVLEASDDAAIANWGGSWRMPTTADFQALGAAVNTTWTQFNNVYGILCTDKTDESKTLFFPAAGSCSNGANYTGSNGGYWSSSLLTNHRENAYRLDFRSSNAGWNDYAPRFVCFTVRPVIG